KFAHVARPLVADERIQRLARDAGDEAPGLLFVVLKKMDDERVDVARALAQGGQLDRKDRQTIEQIATKTSLLDRALKVNVRRSDHTHINLQNFIAADARKLAVLQHAQQTHLRRQTHLADLIEKERAAVRLFKSAAPTLACVRERALLVPEEFGFKQRLRDRAAVEFDVRALAALRVVVNQIREQLFARARLALNEHG